MDALLASRILELLAKGVHPETGEILSGDHVLTHPDVVHALQYAIASLQKDAEKSRPDAPLTRKQRLNAGRPWTKVDDVRLRELFLQGYSPEAIAQMTDRRVRGVCNRLMFLQLLAPPQDEPTPPSRPANAGKSWLPDEDECLIRLFRAQISMEEMMAFLGRSRASLLYRMVHLGLIEHPGQYADGLIPWTQQNTDRLRQLHAQGLDVCALAQQFDCTEAAIRARLFYLGLSHDAPPVLPPHPNAKKSPHNR